jgi:hypothetical protein
MSHPKIEPSTSRMLPLDTPANKKVTGHKKEFRGSSLVRETYFSFRRHVQIGSGAHSVSYLHGAPSGEAGSLEGKAINKPLTYTCRQS